MYYPFYGESQESTMVLDRRSITEAVGHFWALPRLRLLVFQQLHAYPSLNSDPELYPSENQNLSPNWVRPLGYLLFSLTALIGDHIY